MDIQEFLRLLTYVPSNQVQLSTGHENCKLVFCRIAWKGSTDKKVLEKRSIGRSHISHVGHTCIVSECLLHIMQFLNTKVG